jgi:GDP-L-fucose synthase
VTLWGTGAPRREFLHVLDAAEAIVFLMDRLDDPDIMNVGTGEEISIRDLAERIARAAGFRGEIRWDTGKPDGMPRKCLDSTRLERTGFRSKINLETGIRLTIEEYRRLKAEGRIV